MTINTEKYTVELIERELIDVNLSTIDIVNNTKQFTESLEKYLILNETPTQLSSKTFQTANNYIADSILVFFNGISEKYINKLSDNTFSFNIPIIAGDTIMINYFKQP